MSQLNLSMKIGVCQETVSSYENGRAVPTIETAIAIAKLFSVSLDYLFGLDEIPKRENENTIDSFEYHLIDSYRLLDIRGKEELQRIADVLVTAKLQNK